MNVLELWVLHASWLLAVVEAKELLIYYWHPALPVEGRYSFIFEAVVTRLSGRRTYLPSSAANTHIFFQAVLNAAKEYSVAKSVPFDQLPCPKCKTVPSEGHEFAAVVDTQAPQAANVDTQAEQGPSYSLESLGWNETPALEVATIVADSPTPAPASPGDGVTSTHSGECMWALTCR